MTMPTHTGRFLTAEWRYLLMLNFEVDPSLVAPYVPRGTEIDFWNGKTFVSLVGFRFLSTRVLGMPIPFHRDFDEINLRFYVSRREGDELRRGVVFIKEIVPRGMISCVARTVYNENYVTRRMRHELQIPASDTPGRVQYEWRHQGQWNRIGATFAGEPTFARPDSEETFITEHYRGYTRQRDGGTIEYEVQHPTWRVWQATDLIVDGAVSVEYGGEFATVLAQTPSSAFVADGSAIVVHRGRRIA